MPREPANGTEKPARRAYGDGSVYQRRDGRWVASIRHRGKRLPATYHATEREARLALRQMVGRIATGRYTEPNREQLDDYLARWIDDRVHELAPRTVEAYHLSRQRWSAIGAIAIGQLRPSHVERVIRDLVASGLHASTVRSTRSLLASALRDAVRLELIPTNPAAATRAPRSTATRAMQVWEPDQIRAFLGVVESDRLRALWRLSLTIGLRDGEARGLKWDDLHLAKRTLIIKRNLNPRATRDGPTKTRTERPVPLTASLVADLRQHRAAQLEERLRRGSGWQDSGRIFTTLSGAALTNHHTARPFLILTQRAGCPRIRLHDLRHTAITWMLSRRVPLATVARVVGHSSPHMTLSRYAHVMPDDLESALQAMSELLDLADEHLSEEAKSSD